jgi:hypothetical protein
MLADLQQYRLIATPESRSTPLEAPTKSVEALLKALQSPGRVCELSGSASSGKSTLALRLCLAALRGGKAAAWVDPTGTFWPLAALEKFGRLDRLLVVQSSDGAQAMRAADVILSSAGAVSVLVVHLLPNHRPSDSQLFRLQRLAEKSLTTLVLLDERPVQTPSLSPSVTLRISAERAAAANDDWAMRLHVRHNKHGHIGPVEDEFSHSPARLAFAQTL